MHATAGGRWLFMQEGALADRDATDAAGGWRLALPARRHMHPMLTKVDRLALMACLTAGVIFGLAQATGFIADPYDARAYWDVDFGNLYLTHFIGGYIYPPPLALVLAPFHPLGFGIYIVTFTTATWAAFWYLTRAFALPVLLTSLALVPFIGGNVIGYLFIGNIQIIMAAAVVASIRLSPVWSVVPLLTKLVPVSLVWYAVRREWRSLAVALGATAAIVAVTFAIAPGTWAAFVRFIVDNRDAVPLPTVPIAYPVRLLMAVALTAWGAQTDRRWPVMIAAGLAIPALYEWSYLAIWIGVIGIEWDTQKSPALIEKPTSAATSEPSDC